MSTTRTEKTKELTAEINSLSEVETYLTDSLAKYYSGKSIYLTHNMHGSEFLHINGSSANPTAVDKAVIAALQEELARIKGRISIASLRLARLREE